MTPARRRTILVVALLLVAGGVAALFVPTRRSGRSAVPARAEDATRILRDVGAWDAATHDERRGAAAWVAARTDGFVFDGTEEFGFTGHRHEIAVFAHAATGLEFSLIPGGTFRMGSPESETDRIPDETQHAVTITRAFLLARTECTQAVYERVMGTNPSTSTVAPDHPVETVSWDDAQAFNAKTGLRLPTEAEWEFACRAGTTTRFWSGDREEDLARVGWYGGNTDASQRMPSSVFVKLGVKPPMQSHQRVASGSANPFGLHEMHGNVWEWCADGYDGYPAGAATDPTGDEAAEERVIRGGFWNSPAGFARSAKRFGSYPGSRYDHLGFRPARSVAP